MEGEEKGSSSRPKPCGILHALPPSIFAESGLSKRTIQNHVDNMLAAQGGEIIRDVNETPSLEKGGRRKARPRCNPRGRRAADP